MLAEIIGPDVLVVLALIAVLLGGFRLPKLARSLGSAKSEFDKGLREGESTPPGPRGGADHDDPQRTRGADRRARVAGTIR
jgi:sec-independent protein translocase protein TatA